VRATFLPVAPAALDRVLPFMARLYEQDELSYDPARARAVSEWLIANPESGAIWVIDVDGVDAGYMVVTACVSIEFGGRFALLDELYLDPPWRGHGIGLQAIDFAAAWAGARAMTALRLETATDNAHAMHVYRKAGFTLDARHLMTKYLSAQESVATPI
jgi:GNAT superfamily N-acetyltransferase